MMRSVNDIFEAIDADGFKASTLQLIDEFVNDIEMDPQTFLDLINKSMQDSARLVRLSLGRPSSQATLQEALQQVAMLKAAKEAQQTGK